MSNAVINIAGKVKLLFELITQPNGKKFTYENIKNMGEVEPSTLSRIRNGQNQDPLFSNMVGLANAFDVSLDYFATEMTEDEARAYILQNRDKEYLAELKAQERERIHSRADGLAKRTYHLDQEAIDAVESIVNYVLRQKGIEIEDDESATPS